jgi:hypothetical protein
MKPEMNILHPGCALCSQDGGVIKRNERSRWGGFDGDD